MGEGKRSEFAPPSLFNFSAAWGAAGDHKVRVVEIDGNPWFVAADVCRCLALDLSGGTHSLLRPLNADEKQVVDKGNVNFTSPSIFTGTASRVSIISESWSEPLGLDHIAPSELSRLLGEQGFEFLGGSVAEG